MTTTDKITRLEVIDHTKDYDNGGGRCYVRWDDNIKIELSYQDDGKTLKIFISKRKI